MVSLKKRPRMLNSIQVAASVRIAAEALEGTVHTPAWDVQAFSEVRAAFAQVLKLAAEEMEYALPKN